ncbi:MAG: DUF4474 domain-containing protein [Erysipelotrichales bacterium]|nr:DUF4474 domain-containing protein [Erysipelotrichales bacterium]
MIIICLIFVLFIYTLVKSILYMIVSKYGKFSYDGLSIAGFSYDSKDDLFYSTRNAWQKNFGYTHLYDVCAPLFRMIMDTEPVRFFYNGKHWLITFWKGQYGITTGAEIGVYSTKESIINNKTVYLPVEENEMLDMSFILYKNNIRIMKIDAKHWWLAAFKLGMFSNPKELSMDINITFPNEEMLNAFLSAFKKLGYKDKHYKVIDTTFIFNYKKPRTSKVWTRGVISDYIIQLLNKKNVNLYNKYLIDYLDNNKIDDSENEHDYILVSKFIPEIFKTDNQRKENNVVFEDKRGDYFE